MAAPSLHDEERETPTMRITRVDLYPAVIRLYVMATLSVSEGWLFLTVMQNGDFKVFFTQ